MFKRSCGGVQVEVHILLDGCDGARGNPSLGSCAITGQKNVGPGLSLTISDWTVSLRVGSQFLLDSQLHR